jgi:WXG100 family type VII secretion target
MAAPQVRSDRDQLKTIADSFNKEAERVEQVTRDLTSKMDTLQGGDWIGQGANQFYQEMESQVIPHLNKLRNAMGEAARVTGQISQLMQETEEKTSKILIVIRLG